jgi:NAD(P)H dehydrogenase (quinone)
VSKSETLLVTGTTGHLGRGVLEWLQTNHTGPIIAATRTPEKLADVATTGVEVRHADFDEPDSLVPAFQGADRLLLISTDALGISGKRITQHQNAIHAAHQAGVSHMVYTSFGKPHADSTQSILADHYATEQALIASPMGWTILRNNLYMESLVETLRRAIAQGQLVNGMGRGRIGYVTRKDCSRAAAAALAMPFTGQRILDITGPTAPTQAELAALASDIAGTLIPYVSVSSEALIGILEQGGMPSPVAKMIAGFDAVVANGGFDAVSDSVEQLTGIPPMTVEAYLTQQKDALFPPA